MEIIVEHGEGTTSGYAAFDDVVLEKTEACETTPPEAEPNRQDFRCDFETDFCNMNVYQDGSEFHFERYTGKEVINMPYTNLPQEDFLHSADGHYAAAEAILRSGDGMVYFPFSRVLLVFTVFVFQPFEQTCRLRLLMGGLWTKNALNFGLPQHQTMQ